MINNTCRYCNEDKDGYTQVLDKQGHFSIWSHKAKLVVNWYGHKTDLDISFCPMCGRKLREEHE